MALHPPTLDMFHSKSDCQPLQPVSVLLQQSCSTPTSSRTASSSSSDASPTSSMLTTPESPPFKFGQTNPKHRDGHSKAQSPLKHMPDRFVPLRRDPDDLVRSFHTNTPPSQLSSPERLSRQDVTASDPFAPSHSSSTDNRSSYAAQLPPRPVRPIQNLGSLPGITNSQFSPPGSVFRNASAGSVWNVGGPTPITTYSPVSAVPNGRGRMLSSGTNAPLFKSNFIINPSNELQQHENRLAAALDFDLKKRVLKFRNSKDDLNQSGFSEDRTKWINGSWIRGGIYGGKQPEKEASSKYKIPATPFRVLDAPGLRDDFYCSLIAYCETAESLAVGLDRRVYIWSEFHEVQPMTHSLDPESPFVTALAFSSTAGGQSILAIARADGHLALWSLLEQAPRFEAQQPILIDSNDVVNTEELLVGDDIGNVYHYAIEWPNAEDCATGACHHPSTPTHREHAIPGQNGTLALPPGQEVHRFPHSAAVKALAFCPWRSGLLATGGGSNDRCIHFWHVSTGASLATIAVAAQVTSLIWSPLRREIAATFGYAQPEHPVRIAVFSWPDCAQLVAIPWPTDARALFAVPYPRGPSREQTPGEGDAWTRRSRSEGCVVVVGSDQSVRFHEVWSEGRRVEAGLGPLGGSRVLEELEGIEREGEVIR
ncbi:MAG: hypothetical protein M1814_005025 [Vezdaea aestivalis]|nr:MAG: hypothetical protein M1814_005025 [Vezdaea aestivalis]